MPWAHLPFVKAELQAFPHRKALSLRGYGPMGSHLKVHVALAVWEGGVSTMILKGFLCVGGCMWARFCI